MVINGYRSWMKRSCSLMNRSQNKRLRGCIVPYSFYLTQSVVKKFPQSGKGAVGRSKVRTSRERAAWQWEIRSTHRYIAFILTVMSSHYVLGWSPVVNAPRWSLQSPSLLCIWYPTASPSCGQKSLYNGTHSISDVKGGVRLAKQWWLKRKVVCFMVLMTKTKNHNKS